MSMHADISVLIASGHDRVGLVRAIASARSHVGGEQLELIVIDDGSEPRLTFGSAPDAPKVLRQQTVLGRSAAWNRGIAEATGRYVAFLDDRTTWRPAFLGTLLNGMRADGVRWGHSAVASSTRSVALTSVAYHHAMQGKPGANPVPRAAPAILAERALLWEAGGFAPSYGALAGWELALRLARIADGYRSPDPLVDISGQPDGRWTLRDIVLERRTLLEREARAAWPPRPTP